MPSTYFWVRYWINQWIPLPTVASMKPEVAGKVIIVTGANVGLGFEASKHLARLNPARLILACRDDKKGEDAAAAIKRLTGYQNAEYWKLDLGSFDSVKSFADRFAREGGGKLDILLENAGIGTKTYRRTSDGFESTVEVNHISTAYLAFRLLPFLLAAPEPRLAIVGSGAHILVSNLDEFVGDEVKVLEKLSDEKYCMPEVMGMRYPWSKLLNVFFARGFAAHLPSSSALTLVLINPGFCRSQLSRENQTYRRELFALWMARSTEMGSRTLIHGSTAPSLMGEKGTFLNDCAPQEVSELARSEQGKVVQEKVWNETLDILSKVDPEIQKIRQQYLV